MGVRLQAAIRGIGIARGRDKFLPHDQEGLIERVLSDSLERRTFSTALSPDVKGRWLAVCLFVCLDIGVPQLSAEPRTVVFDDSLKLTLS